MDEARPYLELAHFTPEAMLTKGRIVAHVVAFVVNLIAYFDAMRARRPPAALAVRKLNAAPVPHDAGNDGADLLK